jgi:hypothetical protein
VGARVRAGEGRVPCGRDMRPLLLESMRAETTHSNEGGKSVLAVEPMRSLTQHVAVPIHQVETRWFATGGSARRALQRSDQARDGGAS